MGETPKTTLAPQRSGSSSRETRPRGWLPKIALAPPQATSEPVRGTRRNFLPNSLIPWSPTKEVHPSAPSLLWVGFLDFAFWLTRLRAYTVRQRVKEGFPPQATALAQR
jgi:hypothetical protein